MVQCCYVFLSDVLVQGDVFFEVNLIYVQGFLSKSSLRV